MDGPRTPKAVAAPALRGPGGDDDDERPIGDPDPDDGDWDDDDFDEDDDDDPLLVAPAVPDSGMMRSLRRITPAR